jgi:hypothetical protein
MTKNVDIVAQVVEAQLLRSGVQVVDPGHDVVGGFPRHLDIRVDEQGVRHWSAAGRFADVKGDIDGAGGPPVHAVEALGQHIRCC